MFEIRVFLNVWMHKCKVKYTSQIKFEDKLYEHIHRDPISLMIVNVDNRSNPINEKENSENEKNGENASKL